MNPVRTTHKLNHPMSDFVSAVSFYDGFVELAFFQDVEREEGILDREWQLEIIPEFAYEAQPEIGDTLVYPDVPNIKFEKFLQKYGTGE